MSKRLRGWTPDVKKPDLSKGRLNVTYGLGVMSDHLGVHQSDL